MKKIENYLRAIRHLKEAVDTYSAQPENDLYRDGLIQRFEFTVELAWKSLKEYLEDQGVTITRATPKAVLKDAFAAGVIQDDQIWILILDARNLTSHIYSEETAQNIARQVCSDFLPTLQRLETFYLENT